MQRVIAVDLARTVALAGMVVFHFTYDLMLFGHLPQGFVFQGIWPYFARIVAGSFLFLAGVSLWLAHGQGIRWPAFWRRLAVLVVAALAVNIGTYVALGDQFVRWGILHMIAAGSVLALPFLRAPLALVIAVAVGVFTLPIYFEHSAFNGPWFLWLGLQTEGPLMADYEPVFPWLAPVLAGVAVGRVVDWGRLAIAPGPTLHRLTWPAKHSLAIYLIHQPVLIGLVGLYTWVTT